MSTDWLIWIQNLVIHFHLSFSLLFEQISLLNMICSGLTQCRCKQFWIWSEVECFEDSFIIYIFRLFIQQVNILLGHNSTIYITKCKFYISNMSQHQSPIVLILFVIRHCDKALCWCFVYILNLYRLCFLWLYPYIV